VPGGPTVGARAGFTYALAARATLDFGFFGSTRFIEGQVQIDGTLSVGITGVANLFHSGARPRGTDPRPGREIGETRIGSPPPPNVIDEPPPLPDIEPPPEEETALRAPPPNTPPPALVEPPPDPKKKKTTKKLVEPPPEEGAPAQQ
jgi:hypothetical protein